MDVWGDGEVSKSVCAGEEGGGAAACRTQIMQRALYFLHARIVYMYIIEILTCNYPHLTPHAWGGGPNMHAWMPAWAAGQLSTLAY